jgi:hypothetical protein
VQIIAGRIVAAKPPKSGRFLRQDGLMETVSI